MNGRSLEQIVDDAVRRARDAGEPPDVDALLTDVLADPDMAIIMDGYRMHDRSEGLEGVIERDVRSMIGRALQPET